MATFYSSRRSSTMPQLVHGMVHSTCRFDVTHEYRVAAVRAGARAIRHGMATESELMMAP